MSHATLASAISKVLASSLVKDRVEILWHAGEPLAAGIDHYRDAVELIATHARSDLRVDKSIQTNGTLLTDDWCTFIADNRIGIGISIDGPAFLHDSERVGWSGRGSHERAMSGYRRLSRHGIAAGAICVITRKSLDFADEIFDFFVENEFTSLAFNVEEIENNHASTSLSGARENSAVVDLYRGFFNRIFDRWSVDPQVIRLREFDSLLAVIDEKLRDPSYERTPFETRPLAIVTIQKNGDISTYSPEFAGGTCERLDNFVIGNIDQISSIDEVLASPTLGKMRREIARGVERCANSCTYFDLCGASYVSNKFFENGRLDSTETTACRLHRQELANVVLHKLSRTFTPA